MTYTPPKYPDAIPTYAEVWPHVDDIDWMNVAAWDALVKELRAALIELGVLPKGSYADVAARLAAMIAIAAPADGDVIIRSGGVWARLPKDADGKVLTLVSGLPAWAAGGGGAGIPAGLIAIWHGTIANIPTGWVLCDGTNGTPDLKDKFVKGVPASTNPGATGGAATVTLDATMIPSHQHSISSDGAHTHTINKAWDLEEASEAITGATHIGTMPTSSAGAHTHGANTGLIGGGLAHENRPPYYEVAFIMKT